jgi:hypothetical protein
VRLLLTSAGLLGPRELSPYPCTLAGRRASADTFVGALRRFGHAGRVSDETVANRNSKVWHGATENGP